MKNSKIISIIVSCFVILLSSNLAQAADLKIQVLKQVHALNTYTPTFLNAWIPGNIHTEDKSYFLTRQGNLLELNYPRWLVENTGSYQLATIKIFKAITTKDRRILRGDILLNLRNVEIKLTDVEKINFTSQFQCSAVIHLSTLSSKNWKMLTELDPNCSQNL